MKPNYFGILWFSNYCLVIPYCCVAASRGIKKWASPSEYKRSLIPLNHHVESKCSDRGLYSAVMKWATTHRSRHWSVCVCVCVWASALCNCGRPLCKGASRWNEANPFWQKITAAPKYLITYFPWLHRGTPAKLISFRLSRWKIQRLFISQLEEIKHNEFDRRL